MILDCRACSAQNFVSGERMAVAEVPPSCWKCGAPLETGRETGSGAKESNGGGRQANTPGGVENA